MVSVLDMFFEVYFLYIIFWNHLSQICQYDDNYAKTGVEPGVETLGISSEP